MRMILFPLGFILGLIVMMACGSGGEFPFKYYNIELPADCYRDGKLLGKSGHHGWKDLPLSSCQPDADGNKTKCTVAFTGDFYAAKGEFEKCQVELSDLQKRCKSNVQ